MLAHAPHTCSSLSSPLTPLMLNTDLLAVDPGEKELLLDSFCQEESTTDIQDKYSAVDSSEQNFLGNSVPVVISPVIGQTSNKQSLPSEDLVQQEGELESSDDEEEQPITREEFEVPIGPDYTAPRVGEQYQCEIPELLSEKQRNCYEEEMSDFSQLVYLPPEDTSRYSNFEAAELKLKQTLGSGQVYREKLFQVFYQKNYNVTDMISYVLENPLSVRFATRDLFTPLEKDLFEVGLREFETKFFKIQQLIKTKTVTEIYTYYYYWKSTARCTRFYNLLSDELFESSLTKKRRTKMFLERLIVQHNDPKLDSVVVDVSFDWTQLGSLPTEVSDIKQLPSFRVKQDMLTAQLSANVRSSTSSITLEEGWDLLPSQSCRTLSNIKKRPLSPLGEVSNFKEIAPKRPKLE